MKINLSGLAGALNAMGGINKAKQEEEDKTKLDALRERQMQVAEKGEEDQRISENDRAAEAFQRLGLERDQNQLSRDQFEFAQGEAQRKVSEQHLNEAAARAEYKRLYGKSPEPGMDLNTLHDEIITRMQGDQRVREIKTQYDHDQTKQLEMATRQMSLAQNNYNTLRRYKTDAINAIMMDKSLSKEEKMGVLSGDPAMSRAVFMKKTGRDLDQELDAAALAVTQISQQAFTLTGQAYPGQSALAASAIQKSLPFKFQDPKTQTAIAADISAKLKAGQPIDMKSAAIAGVPVDSIAKAQGFQLDPMTGQSQSIPKGTPVPAVGQPSTMPTLAQAMSNSLTTDNAATSLFDPSANHGASGTFGGAPASAPAASAPAPSSPAPSAATPQAASQPGMFQYPPAVSGPGALPPAAARGNSQIVAGMPGALSTVIPAMGMQGSAEQNLRIARSLPEAESQARTLLNLGADYDTVISYAPAKYQSMLAAKLPKRVPTNAAASAGTGAPPGTQQPPLTAPLFSPPAATPPFGPNSLSPSRPLFSPPNY